MEGQGEAGLAKKPTKWMTNAPKLAAALNIQCDGQHEHLPILGGNRSAQAQVYPAKLVRIIIKGLDAQIRSDAQLPQSSRQDLLTLVGPCSHEASVDVGPIQRETLGR